VKNPSILRTMLTDTLAIAAELTAICAFIACVLTWALILGGGQ